MIIDCDRCEVRGNACGSCVIGVLVQADEDDRPIPYLPVDVPNGGPAAAPVEFAEPERRALQVLADQGLIPHLRLVETGGSAPARPGPDHREPAALLPMPDRPVRHRDVG